MIMDQVDVMNYRFYTQVDENPDAPYYIGFIAEDTPALLSGRNQDGLATGDCIGFLMAVVKEQQKQIESLKAEMDEVRR